MKRALRGWLALALTLAVLLAACGAPPGGQSQGESAPPGQASAPASTAQPEKSEAPPASVSQPEESEASPASTPQPEESEAPPASASQPEESEASPESAPPSEEDETPPAENTLTVTEDGWYNTKEEVALYLHLYNRLPDNYVTKNEAEEKGWRGGSVEKYTGEGTAIGGSRFGNYEKLLPEKKGRRYTECDINTVGKRQRGAERIIFSNDGLIYYTGDHYKSFEQLYGEP